MLIHIRMRSFKISRPTDSQKMRIQMWIFLWLRDGNDRFQKSIMRPTNTHSPFTLNLKNTGDLYFLKRETERIKTVFVWKCSETVIRQPKTFMQRVNNAERLRIFKSERSIVWERIVKNVHSTVAGVHAHASKNERRTVDFSMKF